MKTAKQTRREAKQLFRLCIVNGMVDEDRVRKVVESVLQFRRRGYLALLGYFQRFLKLHQTQHTAEIQSAVPLPTDLEIKLRAGLQHMYGPRISTLFVHNPALIGGIRIHIGSDVYRWECAVWVSCAGEEFWNYKHERKERIDLMPTRKLCIQ